MTISSLTLRAGARGSQLARIQSRDALDRIERLLPSLAFELVAIDTPGDRDRSTALTASDPDFFTRDLDDAVRDGRVDCAVHSAKDMPYPVPGGLDWFWLPWREDARDAIVLPPGKRLEDVGASPVVGVSSDRREDFCRRRFPDAQLKGIRGNIEERLAQLDRGDYDLVIIAAAALRRLDLADRISEWISPDELPPPEGQGILGVTFRADDERFRRIRRLFLKPVAFVGAGPGDPEHCTLAGAEALRRCDVCLYDALAERTVAGLLPPTALAENVGKRRGKHSAIQDDISQRLCDLARQGRAVVRLKGGDPGIFGRLAEETEALDQYGLAYTVVPGVSSLFSATSGTGMLLTRRGVARGFTVMTPRRAGGEVVSVGSGERAGLPIVFFMGCSVIDEIVRDLLADGRSADEPAAIILGAGTDEQAIIPATLGTVAERAPDPIPGGLPSTVIVGDICRAEFLYSLDLAPLGGRRVLLTASSDLQDEARARVREAGGVPVPLPLVRLAPDHDAGAALDELAAYDWVVVTSPGAVRCWLDVMHARELDLRRIPKILACGPGTARALAARGLRPDLQPEANFGAEAVVDCARAVVQPGQRWLRLRSDVAGPDLAAALGELGPTVTDLALYRTCPTSPADLPAFDIAFFASASAVRVFCEHWGVDALADKTVLAIGRPTAAELVRQGEPEPIVATEATVAGAMATLAAHFVEARLATSD